MNKIEITAEYYDYYCGDGCCSNHGVDVTYLGYEVDDNYDMGDSYVITAEKER